jgi:LPS-assembly lipoprotein
MSSSDRRRALAWLGGAFALAGCGFRPLYGAGGPAGPLQGNVVVIGASGRFGYHFNQEMRRRVGASSDSPRFALTVALSFREEEFAITEENDATRLNIEGAARYSLVDQTTTKEVASGEAKAVSAYNTLTTPYSTRIAQQDAQRRVAEDLARRVFVRLSAALNGEAVAG